ncbi:MAG: YeeE/YedE family protein [Dehalococcoidia bacterium]|nr:YeeE/YedE family protein [Dehalococcoidia bacterium]
MPLIMNGLTPIHWAVGGAGIAAVTLTLLFVGNRRLGVSTGFEDLCALVLDQPYFRRPSLRAGSGWRLPLLAGMVLGGVLSAVLGGGWEPTWALGTFDTMIGWGPAGKVAWMFVGGLLIGFGTRLAGGCTSGHGIFGLSNLELPSLIATVSFMAAGVVFTNLLYRVIL